jgi:hypothetical protein
MSEETNKPTTKPQLTPEFFRATNFKSVYVNYVQTGYTGMEISIICGENQGVGQGKLTVEQKVKIIMPPLEAVIVVSMLKAVIEQYEAAFGKIPRPEGLEKLPGE